MAETTAKQRALLSLDGLSLGDADRRAYPISAKELREFNIAHADVGDWNYVVRPRAKR